MKIDEIRADRIDSGGSTIAIDRLAGKALPWANTLPTTETELHFHAIANFVKTFDFKPDDRVVFLTDKLLDPRVVAAITGLAMAQGIRPIEVKTHTTNMLEIPAEVKPILEQATFVVSSWFCSAWHPYCIDLRRRLGPALGEDHVLPQPRPAAHRAGALPDRARRRADPRHRRAHPARRRLRRSSSPTAAAATSRSRSPHGCRSATSTATAGAAR